jgi:hypothetical protein
MFQELDGMQRCPYIHEMKERLLSSQGSNPEQKLLEGMDKDVLEIHGDPTVGTVVKVQSLLLSAYNSLYFTISHCSLYCPVIRDTLDCITLFKVIGVLAIILHPTLCFQVWLT